MKIDLLEEDRKILWRILGIDETIKDHEKNFNNIFERLKMLEEKQEEDNLRIEELENAKDILLPEMTPANREDAGSPTFGEIDDLKEKILELEEQLRIERLGRGINHESEKADSFRDEIIVLNRTIKVLEKAVIDKSDKISELESHLQREREFAKRVVNENVELHRKLEPYKRTVNKIRLHIEHGAPKIDASILAEHIRGIIAKGMEEE